MAEINDSMKDLRDPGMVGPNLCREQTDLKEKQQILPYV